MSTSDNKKHNATLSKEAFEVGTRFLEYLAQNSSQQVGKVTNDENSNLRGFFLKKNKPWTDKTHNRYRCNSFKRVECRYLVLSAMASPLSLFRYRFSVLCTRRALAHMRAFCYLVELASGPNHPELSNAYHRMGRAYQDLGSAIMALR